jgi:hypothetical protein
LTNDRASNRRRQKENVELLDEKPTLFLSMRLKYQHAHLALALFCIIADSTPGLVCSACARTHTSFIYMDDKTTRPTAVFDKTNFVRLSLIIIETIL